MSLSRETIQPIERLVTAVEKKDDKEFIKVLLESNIDLTNLLGLDYDELVMWMKLMSYPHLKNAIGCYILYFKYESYNPDEPLYKLLKDAKEINELQKLNLNDLLK